MFDALIKFLFETEDYEVEKTDLDETSSINHLNNNTSMYAVDQFTISQYEDIKYPAQSLKNRHIVILKYELQTNQRAEDFMSGLSYTLEAKDVPLTKTIHLYLPREVSYKRFMS
ncbi:MAG: cell division protein SepF [Erysipelotrichaceae bacterium]|nr:cell division protein SepF [Erysipelotrichaceae bacterium]